MCVQGVEHLRVLSSHQPDFFPYMGYFYKMFQSDVFVFSDDVLFSKTGRHNYNEILTKDGPKRFTLPIHQHTQPLNEIQIAADARTVNRMIKTLWQEYRSAEHFHSVFPVIEDMLSQAPAADNLAKFNHACILKIAARFGLLYDRETILSSALNLQGHRDERILDMCRKLEADVYYSGDAAFDYHVESDYTDNGIILARTDYQPVKYPQVWAPAENMSVIDYVMNCGFTLPPEWRRTYE